MHKFVNYITWIICLASLPRPTQRKSSRNNRRCARRAQQLNRANALRKVSLKLCECDDGAWRAIAPCVRTCSADRRACAPATTTSSSTPKKSAHGRALANFGPWRLKLYIYVYIRGHIVLNAKPKICKERRCMCIFFCCPCTIFAGLTQWHTIYASVFTMRNTHM